MSTTGTYTVSSRRPDRFRSSTQVFVSNSQIETIIGGGDGGGTDRATLDQAKLLLSRPVTEAVIRQLGLRTDPATLVGTVSAEPVSGSNFVSVTAERGSGAEAAAVANAYVREYIRFRNDQLSTDASNAIEQIRQQIKGLPSSRRANAQQRQDLQETIRQIQVTQAAAPSQSRQTDTAIAPSAPFTPSPKRDAVFALFISLGLGLGLAFALERFDRRIKGVEEVTKVYGLPLLATIPHTSTPVDIHDGKAGVPGLLREPFRSLQTNLQLASLDRPIRRLVVTSAIAGEGKTTIVRNLALTYREWGLNVVVLEADLRRPTLTKSFGGVGREAGGLTSVLTGDLSLDDAFVDVDFDIASLEFLDRVRVGSDVERRHGGATTPPRSSRLVLLPSGDTPPNPQAVLAADKMRWVMDQLSERFDVVLIDTPPLLAVSDAMPLLSLCDGVVLVTRVGTTERQAAQRAVAAAQLDPSVNLLGVIANDVAAQPGNGYGYGQGYGYTSSNGHSPQK